MDITQHVKSLIEQAAKRTGRSTRHISLRYGDYGTQDGGFGWEASIIVITGVARRPHLAPPHRVITGYHETDPQKAIDDAVADFQAEQSPLTDRSAEKGPSRELLQQFADEDPALGEKLRAKGLIS